MDVSGREPPRVRVIPYGDVIFAVVAPVFDTGVASTMDGRTTAVVAVGNAKQNERYSLNEGPARSIALSRFGLLVVEHQVEDRLAHRGSRAVRGLVTELKPKAAPKCKKVKISRSRYSPRSPSHHLLHRLGHARAVCLRRWARLVSRF